MSHTIPILIFTASITLIGTVLFGINPLMVKSFIKTGEEAIKPKSNVENSKKINQTCSEPRESKAYDLQKEELHREANWHC